MTKKSLLISSLIMLSPLTYLLSPVSAQTPTATDAASIRDSVKQQVTAELSQIKSAVAKKSFVGNITAKTDAVITINNLLGVSRTALVSTDTTIKLLAGKDGTISDIKVGDYVMAMGDVNSQDSMTTKRLLVIAKPTADKRQTLFATVTAATSTTLTVQTLAKETKTIKLTSTTKYTAKIKAADIKVGSKIVVIGTATSDTALTALRLHLVNP